MVCTIITVAVQARFLFSAFYKCAVQLFHLLNQRGSTPNVSHISHRQCGIFIQYTLAAEQMTSYSLKERFPRGRTDDVSWCDVDCIRSVRVSFCKWTFLWGQMDAGLVLQSVQIFFQEKPEIGISRWNSLTDKALFWEWLAVVAVLCDSKLGATRLPIPWAVAMRCSGQQWLSAQLLSVSEGVMYSKKALRWKNASWHFNYPVAS